jgi:predicted DNA-binding transcriptional regulator AlpA
MKTQTSIPDAFAAFDVSPDSALVAQSVVQKLYSCSPATIWRRVKSGDIPAPIKIVGSTRWRVGDLRKALQIGVAQ